MQYGFGDLLSLIEKARTDFGTRIEIDYDAIRPTDGGRQSDHNCIIGTIYYDPADCEDTGILILIKASMPKKANATGRSSPTKQSKTQTTFGATTTSTKRFLTRAPAINGSMRCSLKASALLGEYIGVQAADKIGAAIEQTLARPEKPSFDWGYRIRERRGNRCRECLQTMALFQSDELVHQI